MPFFIDGHNMKGLTAEQIKKIVNNPPDKHGVTHQEILYNEKENKLFCILEAPNKESIEKHHQDIGIKCDFILETSLAWGGATTRPLRPSEAPWLFMWLWRTPSRHMGPGATRSS